MVFVRVFLGVAALALSAEARPQDVAPDDPNLIHWAYAATFGTGKYSIGDNDVFVFRLPLSRTLRQSTISISGERKIGVKILLPITIGVHDFDIAGALQGQVPDRVEQWSITPGVELDIPISQRWSLRAEGRVGWGSELNGGAESAWIYAASFKSRFNLDDSVTSDLNLLNGVLWSGYTPEGGSHTSISVLLTGLESVRPAGRWRIDGEQVFFKTHLVNYWYLEELEYLVLPGQQPIALDSEWEIGLAIGKEDPFELLGWRFDRVGLAFREGDDSSAVRLLFSSEF